MIVSFSVDKLVQLTVDSKSIATTIFTVSYILRLINDNFLTETVTGF